VTTALLGICGTPNGRRTIDPIFAHEPGSFKAYPRAACPVLVSPSVWWLPALAFALRNKGAVAISSRYLKLRRRKSCGYGEPAYGAFAKCRLLFQCFPWRGEKAAIEQML